MTSKNPTQIDSTQTQTTRHVSDLFLIDEGIHVLNQQVFDAIQARRPEHLARLSRKRVEAGAQALAVNLGPGKHMQQQIPWILDALTAATDVPLFLSASVINNQKILRKYGRKITINAVTANTDNLAQCMKVARQFETGLVVLLVKKDLVPAGVNDRIFLANEVLESAIKADLPLNQLYLDPVLGCRPDPFAQKVSRGFPDLGTIVESLVLIKELHRDVKTILGLGSGSVGIAGEKRSSLQCRMLQILAAARLDAAIINCLDNDLMSLAQNMNSGLLSGPSFHVPAAMASAA